MAGVLPILSSTVQEYEDEGSSDLLATLGNGNLDMGTASRKRRRIAAKYHPEDIQECFHKVHRQFNNPTITDLENSLDETQDELELENIGLQDANRRERQIIESMKQNREEVFLRLIQMKNEEMRRCLQEKDEEMRRRLQEKYEEIRRRLQRKR
ncbi:unnamed protein product [Mytilus edulis]|uniref:Uncharacterized protein n=1 Tax=Mytilus edulis TaxID=6550 RepID=A0A8S3QSC2_MYTED|nr:unnamed protein product [Mytilus edulis]